MLKREHDSTFKVFVIHNFYNGHCYDYSGRSYMVYGRDAEEALKRARTHKAEIEQDLRSKRNHNGTLLIRKSDTYHLKDSDIHSPKYIQEV